MPICRLPDIELYYEEAGRGRPLLFIHGLGSSTREWMAQAAFFRRHYRVITFDLRGHGRSGKPPGPYAIGRFAADTAALLGRLDAGPAHVVGLSLGGAIAFQLALDAPELVKSLGIVNSGPELPLASLKDKWQLVSGFLKRQVIVRLWGMRKMGEVLANNLLPGLEQGRLRQAMIERWAQNDKQAYLAAMLAFRGWSVAGRLADIDCPALIIAAEHDYTPLEFKARYTAQMPKAQLVVIKDARHFAPLEKPERFNQLLWKFLQGLE